MKGHLMAFAATAIWSGSIIVTKDLVSGIPPGQGMLIRFIFASIALWVICPKWKFDLRKEIPIIVISIFGGAFYMLMFNYGALYTYASNVSIINCTSPIFSALLLWVIFKERIKQNQAIGYAIAFIGIVLVIVNGSANPQIIPLGDFMILMSSLFWAIYCIMIIKIDAGCDGIMFTRKMMVYSAILSIPLVMIEGAPFDTELLFTADNLVRFGYLGVFAGAVAYVFWNKGIEKIGVIKTQFYVYIQPVLTLIIAVLLMGENLTLMGVAGFMIVLLGLMTSNMHLNKKRMHR